MRVREQQPFQLPTPLGDERGIGHHYIGTRNAIAAERDSAIDHQPAMRAGRTVAVQIEIHADLAGAPQGQEKQLVGRPGPHRGLLRR
jgi:hypothetical protein